jgi:hypothetical protein
MRLPVLQLSCRVFLFAKHGITPVCQHTYGSLRLLVFPKAKIVFESEETCVSDGHTIHKLSQRRLTADWLAPRESDCSQMRSKVSSDSLPSYNKATRLVLEIFKMARYFPYKPRILANMYRCAAEKLCLMYSKYGCRKLFRKGPKFYYPTWCLIPNTWIFRTDVKSKKDGCPKRLLLFTKFHGFLSNMANTNLYRCQKLKSGILSFRKLGRCLICNRKILQVYFCCHRAS